MIILIYIIGVIITFITCKYLRNLDKEEDNNKWNNVIITIIASIFSFIVLLAILLIVLFYYLIELKDKFNIKPPKWL